MLPRLISEMNREHPASPRIGVGELKVFLFFSHLIVIKMHDRASELRPSKVLGSLS